MGTVVARDQHAGLGVKLPAAVGTGRAADGNIGFIKIADHGVQIVEGIGRQREPFEIGAVDEDAPFDVGHHAGYGRILGQLLHHGGGRLGVGDYGHPRCFIDGTGIFAAVLVVIELDGTAQGIMVDKTR